MQKYICTRCGHRSTIKCRRCPMCEAKNSYEKVLEEPQRKTIVNILALASDETLEIAQVCADSDTTRTELIDYVRKH